MDKFKILEEEILKKQELGETVKGIGFNWEITQTRNGIDIDKWEDHNIVPTEGLVFLLNRLFNKGSGIENWYIGLFSGNYTPVATDTGANIASNSTEFTGYSETTRQAMVVPSSITTASTDNSASVAKFTITAGATLYGGFLISDSAKNGTTGTLFSGLRFPASKTVEAGDTLSVQLTITLISN